MHTFTSIYNWLISSYIDKAIKIAVGWNYKLKEGLESLAINLLLRGNGSENRNVIYLITLYFIVYVLKNQ